MRCDQFAGHVRTCFREVCGGAVRAPVARWARAGCEAVAKRRQSGGESVAMFGQTGCEPVAIRLGP
eukprot:11197024-Lingulodinium_polyedra.AAC.1